MKLKTIICFLLIITPLYGKDYEFYGEHFVASYKNCNAEALTNINELIKVFEQAVLASGATILKHAYSIFPSNGIAAVFLLSESHATIHTYPEHNACFVDLFTCGRDCSYIAFHEILVHYLQPTQVDQEMFIRS